MDGSICDVFTNYVRSLSTLNDVLRQWNFVVDGSKYIEDKTDLIIIGTKQQQNMNIKYSPVILLTSPSDIV